MLFFIKCFLWPYRTLQDLGSAISALCLALVCVCCVRSPTGQKAPNMTSFSAWRHPSTGLGIVATTGTDHLAATATVGRLSNWVWPASSTTPRDNTVPVGDSHTASSNCAQWAKAEPPSSCNCALYLGLGLCGSCPGQSNSRPIISLIISNQWSLS